MRNKSQHSPISASHQGGFGHVVIIAVFVVIGLVGLIGWRVASGGKQDTSKSQAVASAPTQSPQESTQKAAEKSAQLIWQQGDGGWRSMQTPPECSAQPIMKSPVDLAKVTGILYPGQTRGGNYKPHGGFRLDGTANDKVTVVAPLDGFIVRGGSYLAEGEIQYTFDIMNNCGVMYRVGHFRALPANLQKLTASWPAPQENDSRTHQINPAVYVGQGEALATSIGIVASKNTFFDWGVYDYRKQNTASASPAYQQAHAQDKELSWHAVCWFDWLPNADASKVKSLPAGDPGSGKKSDYCSAS